jgi:hypothetical protein
VTQRTVRLRQGDDVTLQVSPLLSPTGGYFDATGASCELLIKTIRGASDSTATVIAGVVSGNTTTGFAATFRIPRGQTDGVALRRWHRARVITTAGDRVTVSYGPLLIEPM